MINNFGIPAPASNIDTLGKDIPVTGGTNPLRIYMPKTNKATYPKIEYYHGGGWVIATIDTYNAPAQALAEKADAILICLEYRKGPEFKFPTAHIMMPLLHTNGHCEMLPPSKAILQKLQ